MFDREQDIVERVIHSLRRPVGIEPAFDAGRALDIIEKTSPYADHYKIGWLNYHRPGELGIETRFTTYREMGLCIINLLEGLGKTFWIKEDFAKKISSAVWTQTDARNAGIKQRRVSAYSF